MGRFEVVAHDGEQLVAQFPAKNSGFITVVSAGKAVLARQYIPHNAFVQFLGNFVLKKLRRRHACPARQTGSTTPLLELYHVDGAERPVGRRCTPLYRAPGTILR